MTLVTGNFFDGLGVRPAIGRLITPEDDRVGGAANVAVLGYGTWERLFGADPAALGRTIKIGQLTAQVIGVTPPEFVGPEPSDPVDVYLPVYAMQPTRPSAHHGTRHDVDARDGTSEAGRAASRPPRRGCAKAGAHDRQGRSGARGDNTRPEHMVLEDGSHGYSERPHQVFAAGRRAHGAGRHHLPHRLRQHRHRCSSCAPAGARARWPCGSRSAPAAARSCANGWPSACCSRSSAVWRACWRRAGSPTCCCSSCLKSTATRFASRPAPRCCCSPRASASPPRASSAGCQRCALHVSTPTTCSAPSVRPAPRAAGASPRWCSPPSSPPRSSSWSARCSSRRRSGTSTIRAPATSARPWCMPAPTSSAPAIRADRCPRR